MQSSNGLPENAESSNIAVVAGKIIVFVYSAATNIPLLCNDMKSDGDFVCWLVECNCAVWLCWSQMQSSFANFVVSVVRKKIHTKTLFATNTSTRDVDIVVFDVFLLVVLVQCLLQTVVHGHFHHM